MADPLIPSLSRDGLRASPSLSRGLDALRETRAWHASFVEMLDRAIAALEGGPPPPPPPVEAKSAAKAGGGHRPAKGFSRETMVQAIAGRSARQAAKELGCSQVTLFKYLRLHGLKLEGRPGHRIVPAPPAPTEIRVAPPPLRAKGRLTCLGAGCGEEFVPDRRGQVKCRACLLRARDSAASEAAE